MDLKMRKVWLNMAQRCYNPNNPGYGKHGAKGVTMCAAWKDSPEQLAADMGPRPEGFGLLLKEGAREYGPDTTYWGPYRLAVRAHEERRMAIEVLRMAHDEGATVEAIALGFPFSEKQIEAIIRGKLYRIAGYPYPTDMRVDRATKVAIQNFCWDNGLKLSGLLRILRKMV